MRRIFIFDTFQGYINVETESEISSVFKRIIDDSTYTTSIHYAEYLRKLMSYHEAENVMSHIKKHQIIEGDVVRTIPRILQNDQSIIIALAYFDLAMFEPTLSVLKAILPRMIKGSLIVLDELGHPNYQSESRIFFELLAEQPHVIKKSEFLSDRSFITLL